MSQIIIVIAAVLALLTATAPSAPLGTDASVVAPKDALPPSGL
jgi:hypothetical protein